MNTLQILTLAFTLAIINYGQPEQHAKNTKKSISSTTYTVNTKLSDGLYMSSENSYRKSFYLKIIGDSATLFGWEPLEKDTIYYSATTKIKITEGNTVNLKFDKYNFSTNPITNDDIDGFNLDTKIQFEYFFLLHNYYVGHVLDGKFLMGATKDSYDSQSDQFEFLKIK